MTLSLNLWYIKSPEFLKFGQQVLSLVVIPDSHKLLSLLRNPQLPLLGGAPPVHGTLMPSNDCQLAALPWLPTATFSPPSP